MLVTNNITFGAGYGDPSRTIRKKYADYNSIQKQIIRLQKENSSIEERIDRITSDISKVKVLIKKAFLFDRGFADMRISELQKEECTLLKKRETNKSDITKLWYGYHERL